ncbi:GTPase HflX [Alicyclobacillus fastidiosus]|uniref:GTPase HflX n=1 Tax=Alicyclobacillus fastidiosus TaxID=392011 RepID=A0ABV5AIN7_9BACL|nr:GTPase HflX [Alicyclobacillus fastidiosus]WEH07825.1 GTPase HflX [Alicyclobacillus fastidiosus]
MQKEENTVILAMCQVGQETDDRVAYREQELTGLCEAAGGTVIGVVSQKRAQVDGRTLLGSGKLDELANLAEQNEADLIVADRELTPAQVRNLERLLPCRIVDRTQLILDIFARRAQTREGRVQVEIAQLNYLMPRLTGRGVELSRLGGGIGTRGPGETQLEMDRRRIRTRMTHLRKELASVERQRATMRGRRRRDVPVVALVGYTNAGKTTLQSMWVRDKANATAPMGQNRLFDTLDPTARQVRTKLGNEYVVIDTVGFVEDLPHHLVDAFKATLEETKYADVIVVVVDAGHEPIAHLETTRKVLDDLGALSKPIVTFFNKMDVSPIQPAPDVHAVETLYGAAAKESLEPLYETVERLLSLDEVRVTLHTHPNDFIWDRLLKNGRIESADPVSSEEWLVTAVTSRRDAHLWQQQRQDGSAHEPQNH